MVGQFGGDDCCVQNGRMMRPQTEMGRGGTRSVNEAPLVVDKLCLFWSWILFSYMNSYAKCLLPRDTHFNEPCRVLKSLITKTYFCKMFVHAHVKSLHIFQTNSFLERVIVVYKPFRLCIQLMLSYTVHVHNLNTYFKQQVLNTYLFYFKHQQQGAYFKLNMRWGMSDY